MSKYEAVAVVGGEMVFSLEVDFEDINKDIKVVFEKGRRLLATKFAEDDFKLFRKKATFDEYMKARGGFIILWREDGYRMPIAFQRTDFFYGKMRASKIIEQKDVMIEWESENNDSILKRMARWIVNKILK